MIYKANCKCGELYLSETYGGYDTVCNKTGKMCPHTRWNEEKQEYIIEDEEECKKHTPSRPPFLGEATKDGCTPSVECAFLHKNV